MHLAEDIFPYFSDIGAKQSDIVLFNFGIWHNDMKTFVGNMSEVFSYLRKHQAGMPFLIWREIAPQHFDTPFGEFACDGCPSAAYPFECKVRHLICSQGLSPSSIAGSIFSCSIFIAGHGAPSSMGNLAWSTA